MPSNSLSATNPEINATVSASAGSGKTWLLVTRIIRLLLAGAEPGGILALTFTRKAAAEMQMRLHERLYAMAIADDKSLDKLLLELDEPTDEKTRQTARILYENLLHSLFPVRLSTFHSFCQEILSRFPLEADIPPGFDLLEDTGLLIKQAWEALFAEATSEPQGLLATDLDLLMQKSNGPANTRLALTNMLHHRSDWWAYTENQPEPTQYAISQLQKQLNIHDIPEPAAQFFNSDTCKNLAEFADLLRQHKTVKKNIEDAGCIDTVLAQDNFAEPSIYALKPVFLTAKNEPRVRKYTKAQEKSMGATGQQCFLDLHESLCEQLTHTLDLLLRLQTFEINCTWYRVGHCFIEIFQRLKRELRQLDFADLEWKCYQLLNTSDNALWIQYKVDQRIKHILIDEFQDTNPTQWHLIYPLLEELAASPEQQNRSVFLVGDEKQSIYSFRRANPKLQIQATAWLQKNLAASSIPLDFSWRSSPAIINFVNQVFERETMREIMPDYPHHDTHLKNLPGQVGMFPLFLPDDETIDEHEPVTIELRNPLLRPRPEKTANAHSGEAKAVADKIQSMTNSSTGISEKGLTRAVNYSDIMILMRNRTHIKEYETALRKKNIPFVSNRRGGLLDNLEIQDLEKLLDTLITPFNNLAIAQILKSPIFSASDEDLVLIAEIGDNSYWYERLLKLAENMDKTHPLCRAARLLPHWRELADTIPVHDLLDRIFAEANIIKRYVSASPDAQKKRVSANLERFLELSLELDSGRYSSLSHFLHYLRSVRIHASDTMHEPVTNTSDERVHIMTIHASKGLEAPIVFLVDCNSRSNNKEAHTTMVDWPENRRQPTHFQLLPGKAQTDSISALVKHKKATAQAREELNLLYVALTRAREYLFFSAAETKKNRSAGWYDLLRKTLTEMTGHETDDFICYTFGQAATIDQKKPVPATAKTEIAAELLKPVPHCPPGDHFIAPSLTHSRTDPIAADETGKGQQRGIIIHHALDLLTRKNTCSVETIKQQYTGLLQTDANAQDIYNWIDEADRLVHNRQFETIFRPAETAQTFNELPLLYKKNEACVYGLIDRLVVYENEILLIDYKTHAGITPEQLSPLAEYYREQLDLYRQGIEKIWPDHKVKTGLLFTHFSEIIWM